MKKLFAVGAASAMMLAASSPAFAQATIGDEFTFVDASQVQVAAALQTNTGDANAAADDGSYASASVDQGLFIYQYQVNGGF